MRKLGLLSLFLVAFMAVSSTLTAATTTINIDPSTVPDEQLPRINNDAPAGFGPDSWQGPATGKSNWHARYLSDGDYLSTLFPTDAATLTIGDIASISYFTYRPDGTPAARDWWIQIYTRPTGTGWYDNKYTNNYGSHTATGSWTEYSTGSGMTFGGLGWNDFVSANGTELVEMISVQTDSGWNGFDGSVDGLTITLNNGNVGVVDFGAQVPAPGAVLLAGFGTAIVGRVRRRM